MAEETAIVKAQEFAQQLNSSPDPDNKDYKAVYVKEENVWIVLVSVKASIAPPNSDFMVKVDANSGEVLGPLGGVAKDKYRQYFPSQEP